MGCSCGQINIFIQNEEKINVVLWMALARKRSFVIMSRLNSLYHKHRRATRPCKEHKGAWCYQNPLHPSKEKQDFLHDLFLLGQQLEIDKYRGDSSLGSLGWSHPLGTISACWGKQGGEEELTPGCRSDPWLQEWPLEWPLAPGRSCPLAPRVPGSRGLAWWGQTEFVQQAEKWPEGKAQADGGDTPQLSAKWTSLHLWVEALEMWDCKTSSCMGGHLGFTASLHGLNPGNRSTSWNTQGWQWHLNIKPSRSWRMKGRAAVLLWGDKLLPVHPLVPCLSFADLCHQNAFWHKLTVWYSFLYSFIQFSYSSEQNFSCCIQKEVLSSGVVTGCCFWQGRSWAPFCDALAQISADVAAVVWTIIGFMTSVIPVNQENSSHNHQSTPR